MSTGGIPLQSRALIIAVACTSGAAATALVNANGSLFGFNRAFIEHPSGSGPGFLSSGFSPGFIPRDMFFVVAAAGGLAAVAALLAIRRAPRVGWIWLLIAGTVPTAAVILPVLPGASVPDLRNNSAYFAVIGAGPVIMLFGLLGAANWLMHGAPGYGSMVAGLALGAPFLGGVLLSATFGNSISIGGLRALSITLAAVSLAGAVGAGALIPKVARLAPPPPPTPRITQVGAVAAVLPVLPTVALLAIGNPSRPGAPSIPFRDWVNVWAVVVGLCGLVIFVAATGVGARLGVPALGAALCAGLVLYGAETSLGLSALTLHNRMNALIFALVGFGLGCAAAVSRWRGWFAGLGCAAAGTATLLTLGRPNTVIGTVLFAIFVFAAVSTVAAAAAEIREHTQMPAVLGAVAVAIQVGLIMASALLTHSEVNPSHMPLREISLAAGIALLVGGALVVAVRLVRTPAPPDQAELSPGPAR